jgi:hypothetical protein
MAKATVGRDSKTGRFVSLKKEKTMFIKAAKAPKAEELKLVDAKPKKKVMVKEEESSVEILKAIYGIDATIIEIDTAKVKIGKKVSNKMAGSDPAPKVKKALTVTAMVYDKEVTKTFSEGEVIEF